jgi:L-lactate dehydrogenase complex protein LldE
LTEPFADDHITVNTTEHYRVGLFVTCLADLFRPSVGFASIALLEQAGCQVTVPMDQSCCGQPAYNSGDYVAAAKTAQNVIASFEFADYVVLPSGSCTGMMVHHYPRILEGEWRERALSLSAKTFELTTFLAEIACPVANEPLPSMPLTVTYHDGCAGLRELNIRDQPRQLLKNMCGIEIKELEKAEVCCGFGGTFCAKMPALSGKMVDDKLANACASGAQVLAGGDLGCLLNIAGRARRQGIDIEVRHVAELLAGDLDEPGIGDAQ